MRNTEDILVVKLGGGHGLDLGQACDDLVTIVQNRPTIVIHGVSAIMNQLCQELDIPVQTLISPTGHSSRYTNPQTRDIYVEAARRANQQIVEELRARNINAISVCEADEIPIHGERKRAIRAVVDGRTRVIRDDYSGIINSVDINHLMNLLNMGYVPVLPPMAVSDDGLLNIDGDRAGAAVARALSADELIILSNVRGLFRDFPNEESFVPVVVSHEVQQALGWAQGRMKRKVLGAQEALEGGVNRVIIGDGRLPSPIQRALAGTGTVFTQ